MLHRARRPGYLTEEVNSTMTAVHIWVAVWLILSGFQGLVRNTVVCGQSSDMGKKVDKFARNFPEFRLNVGREGMFDTLILM